MHCIGYTDAGHTTFKLRQMRQNVTHTGCGKAALPFNRTSEMISPAAVIQRRLTAPTTSSFVSFTASVATSWAAASTKISGGASTHAPKADARLTWSAVLLISSPPVAGESVSQRARNFPAASVFLFFSFLDLLLRHAATVQEVRTQRQPAERKHCAHKQRCQCPSIQAVARCAIASWCAKHALAKRRLPRAASLLPLSASMTVRVLAAREKEALGLGVILGRLSWR